MNTITHIETVINPAGTAWFFCTFALRGKRFVAYIPGNKGDGNGNYDVLIALEDSHDLNRPYEYGDSPDQAFGDDSLPGNLWVKAPTIDDGFSSALPAEEIHREIERRLLGAVAGAYIHPKSGEIVAATVDYFALCDKNQAQSEEAKALHSDIKGYLRGRNMEYSTVALASLGSRRAVKYMMAGAGQ